MVEQRIMPYQDTVDILSCYEIPLAPYRLVRTVGEAVEAYYDLNARVAMKAISAEMTHKSDAGLVRLGLDSAEKVAGNAAELLEILDGHQHEGLLLQTMIPEGVEVILGLISDPQFGPMLAFGPGGILVELLDDVVLRMPVLTHLQAERMVRQSRIWKLLRGYRGKPAADVKALVELIVQLSHLAVEQQDKIASLDFNPVIVLPEGQGVRVVDLRAVSANQI
jgi:acyl-CoA synthetase (NDP forming)